ncbi:hypothetical protein Tco_0666892 [Tanacetum coccineum]
MFALDRNPEILTCGPFRAQGYTQYYHTNMFGALLEEEDGEQGEGAGVPSGLEPGGVCTIQLGLRLTQYSDKEVLSEDRGSRVYGFKLVIPE